MKILTLIWLLFISSCLEKKPGTAILTGGIFNQATFSINDQDASGKTLDFGEHLLTNPAMIVTVKVYNGTDFPYTELDLAFPQTGETSPSTNFLPTAEGAISFPGEGGSCTRTLQSKQSCTIIIEINPREERIFNEIIKLSYKQYVELEEHTATITFLAGMPASLIFTNDKTDYIFGTPSGPDAEPVVERADGELLQQDFEIKNVGGLKAQNLTITPTEFCRSYLPSSDCPTGMFGAYRVEHNCPKILSPQEQCQVSVFYRPLNQNPASGEIPPDITKIYYDLTVTADYITDASGKTAALNAYFKSVSAGIEANFSPLSTAVNFTNEVVSGNRDIRSLGIKNDGWRSGYLHFLSLHDQSKNLIADCFGQDDSDFLNCRDSSNNSPPLSTLPFTIRDSNSCLSTENNKKELAVNKSCSFEIRFQPSVTFLKAKATEFQGLTIHATFDRVYKGQETIDKLEMASLNAKSISQGQVIVQRIRFDGVDYYTQAKGLPSLADLGRLALQNPDFETPKSMLISFKNIGDTRASNIQLRDGSNTTIPIGREMDLGRKHPYFFRGLNANSTNCNSIDPGMECSLTLFFVPVGMEGGADDENANMFDIQGLTTGIKSFIMSYDSGAKFNDDNLYEEGTDYPRQLTEAQITAKLIRKGLLQELSVDKRNTPSFGSGASVNDKVYTYLYLRNIGTGPIPYIQLLSKLPYESWSIVKTLNPQSLGAQYDCKDIVDTELVGPINPTAHPDSRSNFGPLPAVHSCVYTIEVENKPNMRRANSISCRDSDIGNDEEFKRLFYKELDGEKELWEVCHSYSSTNWTGTIFRYFDGDAGAGGTSDEDYGFNFNTKPFTLSLRTSPLNKMYFQDFAPFLTATGYRPGFTLPNLDTGSAQQAQKIIPESWFYGYGMNYFLKESEINAPSFIKAGQSRRVAPNLYYWKEEKDKYDYIYYAGSFPQNSGIINFKPTLVNGAGSPFLITDFKERTIAGNIDYDDTITPNLPLTASGNGLGLNFTLNTANAGEHAHAIEVEFETGQHIAPLIYFQENDMQTRPAQTRKTFKVLILAKVTDAHPQLTAKVIHYDFKIHSDLPPEPIESLPQPLPLSWNYTPVSSTLTFDTVKVEGTPTVYDTYAKKTIILENNTDHPIYGFSTNFRQSTISFGNAMFSSRFALVGNESDCGQTIPARASCRITYKYTPSKSDTTQNVTMTFIYRSLGDEYFMQNLEINLQPRSPGSLQAVSKSTKDIRYKSTPTSTPMIRKSYELQIPSGTYLKTHPATEINFIDSTGNLKKVELQNKEDTKISLLLAYQKYLSENNLRDFSAEYPAGSQVIPEETEYDTTIDGSKYTTIFKRKYSDSDGKDGDDRIVVKASKECFFGDDEDDDLIPLHQKGLAKFVEGGPRCYLLFYFTANSDYLNKNILSTDGDDMRENALELWYYTVNRTASSSIWFNLAGRILPNPSEAMVGRSHYGNVKSLDSRQIVFSTPHFTPMENLLGGVVGVRVYMSDIIGNLSSAKIYENPPTTYFDINYQTDGEWMAEFKTALQNAKFYYFRAVAIRYDASFKFTEARFPGLAAGQYLSLAEDVTDFSLPVPPENHYYLHEMKAIINKDLQVLSAGYLWQAADSTCKSAKITFKTPSNLDKYYVLIDLDLWDSIKEIPIAHNYNYLETAIWVNHPAVRMHEVFAEHPDFNDSFISQYFPNERAFYLKNNDKPDNPLRVTVGATPTSDPDYTSYVPGEWPLANIRCAIYLE